MEDNKNQNPEEENAQEKKEKKSGGGKAANLDAIISSPTDAARSRRSTDGWSNQGTNISYEGQTAPGGMGSVGTGQGSGQSATGARISSSDAYEHANAGKEKNEKGEDLIKPDEENDELDRDTLGTP